MSTSNETLQPQDADRLPLDDGTSQVANQLNKVAQSVHLDPKALEDLRAVALHVAEKDYESTHDPLTGLFNRRGLNEILRRGHPPIAAIYIDLTNQKAINDKISHARGDEALKSVAWAILGSLREDDVAARVGGDEFIVMLSGPKRPDHPDLPEQTDAEVLNIVMGRVAERSQAIMTENPDLAAQGFNVAVGGALWQAGMAVNDLVKTAETNMYQQKAEQHTVTGRHR